MYIRIYVHTHVYVCTHVCIYVCRLRVFEGLQQQDKIPYTTYIHIPNRIYMFTNIYSYIHIYIRIYIYAHIYVLYIYVHAFYV